jgi:hypothetical protein
MKLEQIIEMAKKQKVKPLKTRNFVAKNAPTTGAGRHADKKGKHASRARQKEQMRRDLDY